MTKLIITLLLVLGACTDDRTESEKSFDHARGVNADRVACADVTQYVADISLWGPFDCTSVCESIPAQQAAAPITPSGQPYACCVDRDGRHRCDPARWILVDGRPGVCTMMYGIVTDNHKNGVNWDPCFDPCWDEGACE